MRMHLSAVPNEFQFDHGSLPEMTGQGILANPWRLSEGPWDRWRSCHRQLKDEMARWGMEAPLVPDKIYEPAAFRIVGKAQPRKLIERIAPILCGDRGQLLAANMIGTLEQSAPGEIAPVSLPDLPLRARLRRDLQEPPASPRKSNEQSRRLRAHPR